jgi:phosphoglycerate dehydrogenase-like enzyme
MADAIRAGGGHVVPAAEAEAIVWTNFRNVRALRDLLDEFPGLHWVQLPQAGVEEFGDLIDDERTWTCAKGVYAEPVAELAMSLALAGMRGIGRYARSSVWGGEDGRSLLDARVTILGGGGITDVLLQMLKPFNCHVTVVRNRVQEMDGADVVIESERYVDALPGADLVVLALALTAETEGIISRGELESMERHAWLVNVARGKHIVTADLVWALQNGIIGGAALDVTDPEPLPEGHVLWTLPNCIVTPHVAVTVDMARPRLAERITANVRRFAQGDDLLGLINPDLGY